MGSKMGFDIRKERGARRTSPVLPLLHLPSSGAPTRFCAFKRRAEFLEGVGSYARSRVG